MKLSLLKRPSQLLAAVLLSAMVALAGCGNDSSSTEPDNPQSATGEKKLSVVTSFYPIYYLTSEIGGDYVEVTNLVAAGVEPHDWTPKSQDLNKASKAELFLYHGAGLEAWVDDFLKGLSGDSTVEVKAMSEGIQLIEGEEDEHGHEEEGHGEEGHEHEEEGHEEEGHDHEPEEEGHEEEGHDHDHGGIDPHTWVSPKSALVLAENVKLSLVAADSAHADAYEQNYLALKSKLEAIDADYTEKLSSVSQKNIVVSHQAFGYLARDYGLKQVAIMGLNPDAEPKAQDILEIAKFVKANDVKVIFFEELVSDQLAVTLANEAKVDTMVLNPLEGLTKEQEKAGITYLHLMQSNLQNLVEALQ